MGAFALHQRQKCFAQQLCALCQATDFLGLRQQLVVQCQCCSQCLGSLSIKICIILCFKRCLCEVSDLSLGWRPCRGKLRKSFALSRINTCWCDVARSVKDSHDRHHVRVICEKDHIVAVSTRPEFCTQFDAFSVAMWVAGDFLALGLQLSQKTDRPRCVVLRCVIADVFKVLSGKRRYQQLHGLMFDLRQRTWPSIGRTRLRQVCPGRC